MSGYNTEKEYGSVRIPDRQQVKETASVKAQPQGQISFSDGLFYEIEYDNKPVEGVGKFVLKPQKIEPPQRDEIRELFNRMRDISRRYSSFSSDYSRFFDRKVQQDSARIFYNQAVFMKDFKDDYPRQVNFSGYFPYYQMMDHEQLRTYFTWRTGVHKGIIGHTSLSYVFLYIYELLNNIGVEDPQDGLKRLLSFWNSYKIYDPAIDKYVIRWLKDYHIYYDLPQSFLDFAKEHDLTRHYPKIIDPDNGFDLYCSISKYDIKKSVFYSEETNKLISDCFNFVIEKIRMDFETAGIHFDDALFRPTKKITPWKPFKDALFCQWLDQPDRRVVISENEIYICRQNEWSFSTVITTDKGRQFIGYVMKQMESVLRKITKYKHKITADIDMVNQETLGKLNRSGILIENIIQAAVMEYYREATRTVVTVDHASLDRIRQEALITQEALIVEEQVKSNEDLQLPDQNFFSDPADTENALVSNSWQSLKDILSENELQALAVILRGENIKKFADDNNIMLEVLADGINGKAMDYIGDNILDNELTIYEDYKDQVKGMAGSK